MDPRLLAWGRRVSRRTGLPALWLFTDAARLPDPRRAVARLPPRLAGVVLRHDRAPDRWALGHELARICRARGLLMVVAGDTRLAAALRVGVHLRGGRWPGPVRLPLRPRKHPGSRTYPQAMLSGRIVTSSAHGAAELRRARSAGAHLAFLSPAFPTSSHPGAPGLGVARWAGLARRAGLHVAALGGVDGSSVQRLPLGCCAGMGGITALA